LIQKISVFIVTETIEYLLLILKLRNVIYKYNIILLLTIDITQGSTSSPGF